MEKIAIRHKDGSVIVEYDCPSETPTNPIKWAVERAVREGVGLEGADLRGIDLKGANFEGAILERANFKGSHLRYTNLWCANLKGADLSGIDLRGVNLKGANLEGTNLIDAGQDTRGYRFWAWKHPDGHIVYRGGCREWNSIDEARNHYSHKYYCGGDVTECLALVELMYVLAQKK